MSDLFLILAPLLVLVVVLFLGFAGCDRVFGLEEIPPPQGLTLRLQVDSPLTVVGDVTFTYTPPSPTMTAVTGTATPENNVFEHKVHEPVSGMYTVYCEMTGQLDSVQRHERSTTNQFSLNAGEWAYTFVAHPSPPGPDFDIDHVGLEQVH